jgi:Kae1-associated kinase Bud32
MPNQNLKLIAQATDKHLQNKKNKINECFAVGAEAKIWKDEKTNNVIKERVSKKYRHPELDKKIIKQRTKREAKLLAKASELINAPMPENLQETEKSRTTKIIMPFIEGKKLSENLEKLDWKEICKIIGNQIAKLHDNNIIHGDLTTSNMIWVKNSKENLSKIQEREAKINSDSNKANLQKPNHSQNELPITNIKKSTIAEQAKAIDNKDELYFIDFGLSFNSSRIEDRAVDLHLIKQALEAKHFTIHQEAEKIILDNYNSKERKRVLEQLKKVEARGRYKH